MKTIVKIACISVLTTLAACEQKGPVTKAGERVDEVIDNVKHGDMPLKEKGAGEKLGEAIDDSLDAKKER